MRTDACQCGQTLFFDSSTCIRCQLPVGWCEACHRMATLIATIDGGVACHHADCQAKLKLCENYSMNNICNWTVPLPSEQAYCASCELTDVIPDLADPKHRSQWYRLESAKRRLLYSLDKIGLPFRRSDPAADPALRFKFLDASTTDKPVMTGHQNGCITINLLEADDVEREKARVAFHEPQRTLIGHFRHEIGHYYWDVLVANADENAFRTLFGDERSPTYKEAQKRYYQDGPLPDWEQSYISAYSTMHPWEDFAECFARYLDMVSLLDTAVHHHLVEAPSRDLNEAVLNYQRLAVILNETTRDRGLVDLVPEVLSAPVVEKLRYIHDLVEKFPS